MIDKLIEGNNEINIWRERERGKERKKERKKERRTGYDKGKCNRIAELMQTALGRYPVATKSPVGTEHLNS